MLGRPVLVPAPGGACASLCGHFPKALFKLVPAALKDVFLFVLEGRSGEAEGVRRPCCELSLLRLSDSSYLAQVL